jgi:hypothetical protein
MCNFTANFSSNKTTINEEFLEMHLWKCSKPSFVIEAEKQNQEGLLQEEFWANK